MKQNGSEELPWFIVIHCCLTVFITKKHSGPCGGRDCSGGCQCFPEKGARVTIWMTMLLKLVSLNL
uniref:Uncharacterized protein n=1 Tax=Monopterus albus TaxID=43700 RepID=A0A3Q3IY81_MONAL